MGASGGKDLETRLFELANAQEGLLRLDDLTALGLGRGAIRSRVAARRLNRVHDGVYAFGHTALRPQGRWLAALWTCAPTDVLSHFAAGQHHGWDVDDPEDRIHLTTTGRTCSRDDLVVHRTRHLDRVDVHHVHPLRVTTIPRTLVDLADVLSWPAYRALADAQRSLDVPRIREAQARTPKRPGAPLVTRLIEADDAHTKSEFERRFLRFLTAHALPRPSGLNVPVAGHTADCHYLAQRLVVELDGRAFHQRRAQMRADRHRDTDYQLHGHRILRLLWDDLHPDEAARTADRVRRMLAV
jgi:very-short-patch-repair endonuclease